MTPRDIRCAANIGAKGRRLRLVFGISFLAVGLLAFAGLVVFKTIPLWRLTLLVPFWMGFTGVFQSVGFT